MSKFTDGFVSLIRGMDSGRESDLLDRSQYVRGINISSRGGKVNTRKVWKKVDIEDSKFTTGKFQGGKVYSLDAADRLVFSVAGNLLAVKTSDLSLVDYSSAGTFDATVDQVHFVKADQYFIAQDGINDGLIINYDGNNPDQARARVVGDSELPVGTIMAYGHGRIFVLVSELPLGTPVGERFFVAGDIMLPTDPTTVFKFTETDYLAGGGALSMPEELGLIRGMNFLRNVQSSTGLGSLIVFGQYGASSFSINAPRAQWPDIDLSQVLFNEKNSGTESPYSIVPVNNDLLYRAKDGLRTLGYTISKTAGSGASMASQPFSSEVDEFMDLDNKTQQARVTVANVNDKIYTTYNADIAADGTVIYKGLAVVDFDLITTLGESTTPAWDGAYTGLQFSQILSARRNGKETLFAFAKNPENDENELYYLDEQDDTQYIDGTDSQPKCRLYTRSYNFSPEFPVRRDLVQLAYADIYISDILGKVDIRMYYRPQGHPLWIAFPDTCTVEAEDGSLPQYRHFIRFPVDNDVFSSITGHSYRNATDFEFCIEWEGHMKIRKCLFVCNEKTSQPKIKILARLISSVKALLAPGDDGVELDDYDYSIT